MNLEITKKTFKLNNKNFFLNSAEMQYFRIKRDLWPIHLSKIKDAGCNSVCSYIPWDWHETIEGEFEFDGSATPEKDLIGWINLCKEYGLYVIVKPGPYILAEYVGAGIPEWFIDKYKKECEVKNSKGQKGQDDVMSFMNPTFLDYTKKWYDRIIPIIKANQISENGNIIMMQVCNEVGVFTWLKKQADYSGHCINMYRQFLKEKFKTINVLNELYHSKYDDFSQIDPPLDSGYAYENKNALAKDIDWHDFWRFYYAEYLRFLMDEIRSRGVKLQFYHNLPGWIYGRADEFPINITMYRELYKDYPDIILGVDHIPENISYRNMHDDYIINEMVRASQGNRGPLFAAEFQAGSREYCTVPFPCEMDLFYKASIANGLVGWNYYAFSSGENVKGKGTSGESFYWFSPLDKNANEGSIYPVVKKINGFINTFEQDIVEVDKKSDICVLFYDKYYATELAKNIEADKCDINYNPVALRKNVYFEGILKALNMLNIDFDILDAQFASNEDLLEYKQVWMFACDYMGADIQEKLAFYAKQGGNLILFPTIPKYDITMKDCNILKDALGITESRIEMFDMPKIKAFDSLDISAGNPMNIYDIDKIDEIKIKTINDECCGFIRAIDKGKVFVVGVPFAFAIEHHKDLYIKIIESMGILIDKKSDCKSDRLIVKQRFKDDFSLLFVGNYYNEQECDSIYYTHPVNNKKISIPLNGDKMSIPGIAGFLSPINKELLKGVNLLHTTSDISNIEFIDENIIIITFYGNKDMIGEMAFDTKNELEILVDNDKIQVKEKHGYLFVNYAHTSKQQTLIINT